MKPSLAIISYCNTFKLSHACELYCVYCIACDNRISDDYSVLKVMKTLQHPQTLIPLMQQGTLVMKPAMSQSQNCSVKMEGRGGPISGSEMIFHSRLTAAHLKPATLECMSVMHSTTELG